ncbi:MAG: tol-pal system protein YbgF [Gammaproteobacteria bacterium]|jgi:tol-pal system protein YbgF
MNNRKTGFHLTLLSFMCSVLMVGTVSAQEALTPEQLTLRINKLVDNDKVLVEAAKKTNGSIVILNKDMMILQNELSKVENLVDNKSMIELLQRVEGLSEEVSQLRGEFEQQGHDINSLKKRQRELYLDVDRRLRDLESGAVSQSNSASPIQVPTIPAEESNTPAETTQNSNMNVVTPSINIEISTPSVDSTQTTDVTNQASPPAAEESNFNQSAITSSEERDAYQAAFDTLKEGRYKKAKSEFSRFLEQFPNSGYAGNAQYWLGEAHYVTRNFEQSVIEFENVLSRYSGSNKVPDAMLKLGYTYYEMRQFEQSRAILEDLRKRFDKSTAARLAGKRLDRMRKEGH